MLALLCQSAFAQSESALKSRLTQHQETYSYVLSYGEFLLAQLQRDQVLTGDHLNRIHRALSGFLSETKELYDFALSLPQGLEQTASLVEVTERFKSIRDIYYQETFLRRIVRDQQQFDEYGLKLFDVLTEQLLGRANADDLQGRIMRVSMPQKNFYSDLLVESQSYRSLREGTNLRDFYKQGGNFGDQVNSTIGSITGSLSAGFGALVGNIEWRSGYLYQDQGIFNRVLSDLRPLDLVFEKKSFKLTDKTIPGNWGHVAVWLGTKSQLIELGIWNEPELEPFRAYIERGESIFEMRRWGMQFDSLENFLNLDEIAITRVDDILNRNKRELLQVYVDLYAQMNKGYDFSFDAMATAKVTCTEIIMLSYGNINWPMDRVLGRYSITPNNMAELALFSNSPVSFVSYYRAEKLHELQDLNIDEFADVLDYRSNREHFEKVSRVCRNQRYRHHGAIRMRLKCHDEFEERFYQRAASY